MILTGGLLPSRVFWSVASGVALGANDVFKGIILSASDITLGAGTQVTGRLYAKTLVTLIKNTITQPAGTQAGEWKKAAWVGSLTFDP